MLEHGAYLLLLRRYYITSKPLPTNVEQLLFICRTKDLQEMEAIAKILQEFFVIEDGHYHHKRADLELEKAEEISQVRKNARLKGILSSAAKQQMRNKCSTNAVTNVEQMPTQSHTQSHTHISTKSIGQNTLDLIYEAYPRKVAKRKAKEAITNALGRLQGGEAIIPLTDPQECAQWLHNRVTAYSRSHAGNNGDYTPHPATWFNQSRYLDNSEEWERKEQDERQVSKAEQRARHNLEVLGVFEKSSVFSESGDGEGFDAGGGEAVGVGTGGKDSGAN